MEPAIQPTFIPKKTLSPQTSLRPERNISFFSLITTVFFIVVVLLSGAIFGYEFYLKKQLETKAASLDEQLKKFEPALVAQLGRLDARIVNGRDLLNNHVAVSSLFEALEKMTLKNVRFSNFTYSGGADKKYTLSLDGQAQSFATVALQSVELVKPENQKYLKDVLISGLNLDPRGNVSFKLTATLDPKALLYTAQLSQRTAASAALPVMEITPAPAPASTTPAVGSTTAPKATSTQPVKR